MVLPQPAQTSVTFVDDYCQYYRHLFREVRTFEAFKGLHLGIISELPRKSLVLQLYLCREKVRPFEVMVKASGGLMRSAPD
jgi:hypothetical protein